MIRRAFGEALETISYTKVPITYPKTTALPPTAQDYEILGAKPEDDNRALIEKFRSEVAKVHPVFTKAPSAHLKHSQLEAAYNRIALHRMSEQGVPQPFTLVHNYAHPHTKMIKEFRKSHTVEENSFLTPRVPTNYLPFLVLFWAGFGVVYTLNDWYDPLHFREVLAVIEASE